MVDPVLTVPVVLQELLDCSVAQQQYQGAVGGALVTPISSIISPSPPHIKPTQISTLSMLKPYGLETAASHPSSLVLSPQALWELSLPPQWVDGSS